MAPSAQLCLTPSVGAVCVVVKNESSSPQPIHISVARRQKNADDGTQALRPCFRGTQGGGRPVVRPHAALPISPAAARQEPGNLRVAAAPAAL